MTWKTRLYFKPQTKSYEPPSTLTNWRTSSFDFIVSIESGCLITGLTNQYTLTSISTLVFPFLKILCLDHTFTPFHILRNTSMHQLITSYFKLSKQSKNHTIKSYQSLKFHLTHNFIKLYITLIVPDKHYTNTLIKSISYYVKSIHIYLISKSKSFKIKQPILIKHFIWINSTNYSNTFNNSFNSKLIYILQHLLYLHFHISISNKSQPTQK